MSPLIANSFFFGIPRICVFVWQYNLVDMVTFSVPKTGIVVNILKMPGDVITDHHWSERVLKVFNFGTSVKSL